MNFSKIFRWHKDKVTKFHNYSLLWIYYVLIYRQLIFQNEVYKKCSSLFWMKSVSKSHLACVRGTHLVFLLEAIISLFYFVLSYVTLCPYVVPSALSGSSHPSSPHSSCFCLLQISILGLCPNQCHSNPVPCRKLVTSQIFTVLQYL